ncbi:hypothetical protein B0H12DRAFT_1243144 [Mycena haematopus]|nr:hypothetical protein B0H12DRAFT_1243144 [Mycena haematopus]
MAVFQNLNEDILLAVLTTCDVCTVLCTSQVDKLVRTLALSKPVWIGLVTDLIARCIIDAFSDSDLMNYSAPQLRQMVKRLVCGPTWLNGESVPAVHRQLSVGPADIASNRGGSSWSAEVKLLSGGRFFALEPLDGRLECWSLTTGLCVWTYSQKRCTGYAVDILDRGNTARFLLPGSSNEFSFSIVQVNLTTGVAVEIFRMPRRDEIRWWHDGDATLSGDFVVLTVHIHTSWVVLLINTRKGTYINFQNSTVPGLVVVPGYIIVGTSTLTPTYRPVLSVYTQSSIDAHSRPLTDWPPPAAHAFDFHHSEKGCYIMPAFVVNPGAHEGWQVAPDGVLPVSQGMRLTLRESPLERGTYALTFVLYEQGKFPSWNMSIFHRAGYRFELGAILVTYRLSVSPDGLQLMQTSALPTLPVCNARGISYARYSILQKGVQDVDLRREVTGGRRDFGPITWESIHLSPSSGAQ